MNNNDKFKDRAKLEVGITLILTVFNPKITEIKYWVSVYKKTKNNFLFIIDNPEFNINLLTKRGVNKKAIYSNKKNEGKLASILNLLSKNIIKTTHFKICDPDDYISTLKFRDTEADICLDWCDDLINFKGCMIRSDKEKIDRFTIRRHLAQKSYKDLGNFSNHHIILPTSKFINFNYEFKRRINSTDDKILSLISLLEGSTLRHINKPFYLYRASYGESSNDNIDTFINNCYVSYSEIYNLLLHYNKKINIFNLDDTINWFSKKIDIDTPLEVRENILKLIALLKDVNNLLKNN